MSTASVAEQRFFLTRHSANIMEDLSRQLYQPQTVNVIYGRDGVGKSRLLNEFIATRVNSFAISHFQFIEGGECQVIAATGKENTKPFLFSTDTLRQFVENSLVLLDQFEYATAESKRLILEFWNKYAGDLNCKLIVCGHRQIINQLKDLSLPQGININSVELSPLSFDESQQFLSSRLCKGPGYSIHPTRKLSSQLKKAEGTFHNLNLLIQQHAGLVECKAANDLTQKKLFLQPLFVSVPVFLALLLALYLFGHLEKEHIPEQVSDSPRVGQTEQDDSADLSREIGNSYSSLQLMSEGNDVPTSSPGVQASDAEPVDKQQDSASIDTGTLAIPSDQAEIQTEPMNASPVMETISEVDLVQQRLLATKELLANMDEKMASIQILTLFSKNGQQESILRYFDRLHHAGIDLQQVYVYQAKKKQSLIHGVLFGTYADRKQALQQIERLPDILRENHPIPRTVGGIRQETGL